MRKYFLIALVLSILMTFANMAQAVPQVVLDGKTLTFDVPPVIENNHTMVPLRAIFEDLGAAVQWDGGTQTVTATKGSTEIEVIIGGSAYKNGTPVNIDVPAKIIGDRTMVSLRFVSESLGCQVAWDDATQTIAISTSGADTVIGNTAQDIVRDNAYYLGRWFPRVVKGKATMTALNQGSEIRFSVEGTSSITANFYADPAATCQPYIAYSVDGAAYTRAVVANTVTIATGLQPTRHTVRIIASGIYYNDNVWIAGMGLHFQGLTVDEGAIVEPLISTKKRILFLGNSITAGLNVLGTDGSPATACAEVTFPRIASDILGADPWQVGFGGTSVVAGGPGLVPNAVNSFLWKMNGCPIDEPVPDVIVIAQGANDGAQSPATYQAYYQNYVNLIQATYPGKPIFCMRPFLGTQYPQIQAVAQGTPGCYYVDTTGWSMTFTDGLHPDVKGHKVAGTNLAAAITAVLGAGFFN